MLRHPEVHGGSGFAAATVGDLGFEPTLGATSFYAKPRRARRKKTIEVGEGLSAAGVAAGADTGCGVSAGAAKRPRRKKGEGVSVSALLSLKDLDKMHGQPEEDRRAKKTVKAEGEPDRAVCSGASGGGRAKHNI